MLDYVIAPADVSNVIDGEMFDVEEPRLLIRSRDGLLVKCVEDPDAFFRQVVINGRLYEGEVAGSRSSPS
jgi:hypothetical protein